MMDNSNSKGDDFNASETLDILSEIIREDPVWSEEGDCVPPPPATATVTANAASDQPPTTTIIQMAPPTNGNTPPAKERFSQIQQSVSERKLQLSQRRLSQSPEKSPSMQMKLNGKHNHMGSPSSPIAMSKTLEELCPDECKARTPSPSPTGSRPRTRSSTSGSVPNTPKTRSTPISNDKEPEPEPDVAEPEQSAESDSKLATVNGDTTEGEQPISNGHTDNEPITEHSSNPSTSSATVIHTDQDHAESSQDQEVQSDTVDPESNTEKPVQIPELNKTSSKSSDEPEVIDLDNSPQKQVTDPPKLMDASEGCKEADPPKLMDASEGCKEAEPEGDVEAGSSKEWTVDELLGDVLTKIHAELDKVDTEHGRQSLLTYMKTAIQEMALPHQAAFTKFLASDPMRLPGFVTEPPSQVVHLLFGHDASAAAVHSKCEQLFGDKPAPISEAEKRDRMLFKRSNNAPAFTYATFMLGLDLAQERVYSDVVSTRRNIFTYNRSVEDYERICTQLRPLLSDLKEKNLVFNESKIMRKCEKCAFRTSSNLVMQTHLQDPHLINNRWVCSYCPHNCFLFDAMLTHFKTVHNTVPLVTKEDLSKQFPCTLCEMTFTGGRAMQDHIRSCKLEQYKRLPTFLAPALADQAAFNTWLWPKTPTIQPESASNASFAYTLKVNAVDGRLTGQLLDLKAERQRQAALFLGAAKVNTLPHVTALQQQQLALRAVRNQPKIIQQNAARQLRAGQPAAALNPRHSLVHNRLTSMPHSQTRTVGKAVMSNVVGSATNPQPTPAIIKALAERASGNRGSFEAVMRGVVNVDALDTPQRKRLYEPVRCEICDQTLIGAVLLLYHLQMSHQLLKQKTAPEVVSGGAPLGCSRCEARFWTYDGLERHLLMSHCLVTNDLLAKAKKRQDAGRCTKCDKQYAFNLLQHLVHDHNVRLCSAEIVYSCDVCDFRCSSYVQLDSHLLATHPTQPAQQQASAINKLGPTPQGINALIMNERMFRAQAQNKTGSSPGMARAALGKRMYPANASTMLNMPLSATAALHNKQMRLATHNANANMSDPKQSQKMKYTCTPCQLKFFEYADVIKHWQLKHLKQVKVGVCRVDKCETHNAELNDQAELNIDWTLPQPTPDEKKEEMITLD